MSDERATKPTKPPIDHVLRAHINHVVLSNCLAELIEEYLIWHEKNKFVMPPTLKSFASWLKQRGR